VFYRLLSGQLPFRASSAAEYRRLHREAELPLAPLYAACPDLLPQLLDVMRCATAKKPAERYPSADAMKQALDLCQEALGEWRQEEAKRAWDLLQDVIQQDPAGLCASPDIDKAAQDTSSASETSASTQAKAPEDSHITTEQDYEQRSDCGIGEYIDTNKTQALATKIAPQIPSLILPDFEELEFMPNSEVSHKEPKT
jgi:serine/threonine protein kinase